MTIANEEILSPQEIVEVLKRLSKAVRLIAIEAKSKPSQPNIEEAIALAVEAENLIQSGSVDKI